MQNFAVEMPLAPVRSAAVDAKKYAPLKMSEVLERFVVAERAKGIDGRVESEVAPIANFVICLLDDPVMLDINGDRLLTIKREVVEIPLPNYFLRGLITNLLNPKASIFYLAVLPTFVNEFRPLLGQTIALSTIYVTVATVIHSAIVLLADTARPWLEDQERSVIIRRIFALLLVVIAIWLLFATRYKPFV
jgi:hypothetical protein